MKKRIPLLLFVGAIAASVVLLPSPHRVASDEEVDIIVNKANTTGDLPLADAKKIFVGDKTTWPNGKRVTILMLAAGQPERAVVLQQIYKMSDAEYGKYFMQAAFSGKVSAPPKDVGTPAQMKQAVAENPGAIGYVKKGDVDDTVKVVLKLM